MSAILVVDDESGMRELVTRLLGAAGHSTLVARTAEEAVDLLNLAPDVGVVVADLQMPGHGGAWLVERMAQRYPDVAVILATADDAVPGTLSLKPSIVRYLVKPIAGEQLRAAVEEGIRWHETRVQQVRDHARAPEPVESWLDQKLTRGDGDGRGE